MIDLLIEKGIIYPTSNKLKPDQYFCNTTQEYVRVKDKTTLEDFLQLVYNSGYEQGIEKGKEIRSNQFKKLLNNED